MDGLMMDTPLLISGIAEHAERVHGERELVAVTMDDPRHRTTIGGVVRRSKKLANALAKLGLERGDRIGTLAWNDHRHVELYYGISGSGYVCHTVNPRLFVEQIVYIVNHAGDRWLFVDPMFVPLVENIRDQLPGVEGICVLTTESCMPATRMKDVVCYETLIRDEPERFAWPRLDENTASALCYTSGTTGDPKGVLYSHRSTLLHSYAMMLPDAAGFSGRDVLLPVVPLFHVNAWGIPYSAFMVGAKLVLPGPKMGDGAALYELLDSEDVTCTFGVPTIWMGLLQYCRSTERRLDKLKHLFIGGAAPPRSMVEALREDGIDVRQGWGMTETSPVGTVNCALSGESELPEEQRVELVLKAGRPVPGVEVRIVDPEGAELPWDGVAFGALQVRGPFVCSDYFKLEGAAGTHTADGWFVTGDVATIDPDAYVTITDRTKDVIKSGGEWISSIELENIAVGFPGVAEAAAIGVPHPKWGERPLLVVVPSDGATVDKAELLDHYGGKVASWWVPNDVAFVDELPHTATGKLRKTTLRERFADFLLEE